MTSSMPPSGSASPPSIAAIEQALERWLAALNQRGEPDAVQAAFTSDIRIERHPPRPRAQLGVGEPVEVLQGHAEVTTWLARSPDGTVFALVAAPVLEGEVVQAEYSIAVEDFRNGGRWLLRLEGERICWIGHHPAALEM